MPEREEGIESEVVTGSLAAKISDSRKFMHIGAEHHGFQPDFYIAGQEDIQAPSKAPVRTGRSGDPFIGFPIGPIYRDLQDPRRVTLEPPLSQSSDRHW